jgi:copper(I)-binding protein
MKPFAALFAAAFLLFAQTAWAAGLSADEAWARASMGAGTTGAVFLVLHNDGAQAQRIVSSSTPVAEAAELHTHSMNDGVMQMRQVEALEVPAGGSLMLQPGGDHVMLFGMKQLLQEGETFELTLTSESGESVTLPVAVMSPTHMGPGMGQGSGMGHGSGMGQGSQHGTQMQMQPQN